MTQLEHLEACKEALLKYMIEREKNKPCKGHYKTSLKHWKLSLRAPKQMLEAA